MNPPIVGRLAHPFLACLRRSRFGADRFGRESHSRRTERGVRASDRLPHHSSGGVMRPGPARLRVRFLACACSRWSKCNSILLQLIVPKNTQPRLNGVVRFCCLPRFTHRLPSGRPCIVCPKPAIYAPAAIVLFSSVLCTSLK